jgi:hypothetical protein
MAFRFQVQLWLAAGCLAMLCGCGDSRRWGACSLAGAVLGGGGAAAGVILGAEAAAKDVSGYPYPAQQREDHRVSDIQLYAGIPAAIAGIALGGLAGHYLCDPVADPPAAAAPAPAHATASAQP